MILSRSALFVSECYSTQVHELFELINDHVSGVNVKVVSEIISSLSSESSLNSQHLLLAQVQIEKANLLPEDSILISGL